MKSLKYLYPDLSDYWDARISIGCALYYIFSALNATVKVVLPDSSIVPYLSAICGVVIVIGLVQSLFRVLNRRGGLLFRSMALFGIVYFISFILISFRGEPCDVMIRGNLFITYSWWIPLGVWAASVRNLNVFYDVMLKGSYAILALLTIMFLYHPLTIYGDTGYNMYFGFNLMIPMLFHMNEYFSHKKRKYLILILAEAIMLLVYANRGCWLGILFFAVYKMFWESDAKYGKVFFPLLAGVVLIVFPFMLEEISSLLDSIGISSRSLQMLMNGSFVNDSSNRDDIWKDALAMIEERPIFGWGLGGEYYHMAKIEGATTVDASATPHNGVIQNLVNFGIILGTIVTLYLAKPYFKLKTVTKGSPRNLVMIFGSSILASFFSSASFFTMPSTAIFLYLYYKGSWRNINP